MSVSLHCLLRYLCLTNDGFRNCLISTFLSFQVPKLPTEKQHNGGDNGSADERRHTQRERTALTEHQWQAVARYGNLLDRLERDREREMTTDMREMRVQDGVAREETQRSREARE